MEFLRKLYNFYLAKLTSKSSPQRGRIKRYGGNYMVKMLDAYHNLSQKNIEDLEVKNNIELTDNYKEFLHKWNGGTPDVGVFMISEEEGPTVMHYFFSIGNTYRSEERRVGKKCR